ncbi:MAG: hypothetical protein ACKVIB_10645 [Pseudomonadales bacterium]|jgi:hypothetical protein|tara:strand:+ start:584 stop:790 length:207 start_codon:yes stop_codon:yes gene_type:complete
MSSTDDLIEDDDAVELSDNELTSESHSTSVLKREQAQQRTNLRRSIEQRLEMKLMTEELGIYSDLDHS